MTTKHYSILAARRTPWAWGAFLAGLFAATLHAQQVSTVISTNLLEPNYITVDPNNNIYFTDAANNRIVEFIPTTNAVITFAGLTGPANSGTNNGTGIAARFSDPLGIVYDPYRGGLVVVDSANQVLRFVTLAGAVSNLAGVEATTFNPDGGHVDGPAKTAQFSFPTAIAADGAGNLYVADTGNNAIRRVDKNNVVATIQVTNYTFYGATALTLDASGDLWVADTRNNAICVISNISVITNQSVTVMAGTVGLAGTNDSDNAAEALFNKPSGLLWDPNGAGLFISDTGNHTVRRYFANIGTGGYSVTTVAGIPGVPGIVDGLPAVAEFDNPVGLAVDTINDGYYVVDRANNALRRLQTSPPQPPVTAPQIGYVTFPPSQGTPLSMFNGATEQTFDNPAIIAIIAESGVQTYMTYGPTPPSPYLNTIPTPGPTTGNTPRIYAGDGLPASQTLPTVISPAPDVTMYVVSQAPGRTPSAVVSARFQFVTANPTIGGNNAAAVPLTDDTVGASMWYTLDGTTPVPNATNAFGPITSGGVISFSVTTNVTLTVQAFEPNFAPSGTVVQIFSPSNFVANQISFGFAGGEASSQFVASAGHRFYAPVTLSLLPSVTMYSLQFNVVATNLGAAPALTPTYDFQSMLVQPVTLPSGAQGYEVIPPAGATNPFGPVQSLMFTNTSEDLLGVGWLEIFGETNLYPSGSQDLIAYSLAHETLFTAAAGQAILGGYSFVVPAGATIGQQYQIQLGRPSADADGFAASVFIQTPTNGSLGAGAVNSIKNVTVGVVPYLVGDVAPFHWFNAGDFGDNYLENNDVLETFRAAIYQINRPLANCDFFDAMDCSDGSDNNYYLGNDTSINNIQFGDGQLDVTDVYVTYRRSLDPGLTWYQRYWSNGIHYAQVVPNATLPTKADAKPAATKMLVSGPRYIAAGADMVQAGGNLTVQVPVRVLAADALPVTVLMMNVDIIPLDGSPVVTNTVTFSPAAGLGSPTLAMSQGAANYAGAWLGSASNGVSGTNIIGTLNVTLPPSVNTNSSYLVHFDHFSASPNGVALFHSTVKDGLITVGNRNGSSWNDGIPDWWRLIYFGTVSNLMSAADLDADGDGASNWQEYVAGTNPTDPTSVFALGAGPTSTNFTIQWPSVVGKTYMLESSTSLFSTNWTVLVTNIPGNGQVMQFTDPTPPGQSRYYRALVQ